MPPTRSSALPSPMTFPDVIRPVTARELADLYVAFGRDDSKRYSAEVRYERMSSRIAGWTGHEHTHDRHGRPFNRHEWHESIHKSLSYVNKELALGMDKQMIEVLSLCYLALQESPRYGGDPVIEQVKGENTAVHSIHTMLQAFRVYQKALEQEPSLARNVDFFRSFQATALMMAVHDLGEMLGEAGSLAQVANTGNWAVKDKTALERTVFTFGVKLAIETVIDKKRSEQDFLNIIDRIRTGSHIQDQGSHKSDEEMAREVSALMSEPVSLSARGRKLFDFLQNMWESVENPNHSANPFLGYLAAACERVQGTRHINRMLVTSTSPVFMQDGGIKNVVTHSLTPGYRLLTNSDYSEGHLGLMCAAIDSKSPFQKILAEQAVAWVYETTGDFYRSGPEAFFIDSAFSETPLHRDGSAYTFEEVDRRQHEIALAKALAGAERKKILSDISTLGDDFSKAVIPAGRLALLKEDVLSLYQRAIDTKFLPGLVVDASGKERGQILVRDWPEGIIGHDLTKAVLDKSSKPARLTLQALRKEL